ncbi:MAG TPA: PPE domain-containing protein [Mycobacterium sp.]|nr:PPE domain-containing protein [Mycobacterium sp.]HQC78517.1 PPE domain-containing protein [Mycobacterium sp.]
MPDPAWPSSPPEVNYLRLAGTGAAGTASTLASVAAWQALAASNEVAFSLSSVNSAVTAADFTGVGGLSSSTATTELNTSLQLFAGWTQEKPPVVGSAVSAYETALTSMVPAVVSLANRAEQAADVAMNPVVLGALTPAIVALDAEYFGEHWPHNASAGAAYGATLTALIAALTIPPPLPPPSAASAPAAAAAAMAQEGAQVAVGQAMKQTAALTAKDSAAPVDMTGQAAAMLTQPLQAAMGAAQPALGMFQAPLQSLQGLGSLTQMGGLAQSIPPADDFDAELPMIGAGGVPATGLAGGSAGAGAAGALPTGGLTSYTRPATSFPAENSARPIGLKSVPLNSAELRGPTAVGPMPMSPANLRSSKDSKEESEVARARVATTPRPG